MRTFGRYLCFFCALQFILATQPCILFRNLSSASTQQTAASISSSAQSGATHSCSSAQQTIFVTYTRNLSSASTQQTAALMSSFVWSRATHSRNPELCSLPSQADLHLCLADSSVDLVFRLVQSNLFSQFIFGTHHRNLFSPSIFTAYLRILPSKPKLRLCLIDNSDDLVFRLVRSNIEYQTENQNLCLEPAMLLSRRRSIFGDIGDHALEFISIRPNRQTQKQITDSRNKIVTIGLVPQLLLSIVTSSRSLLQTHFVDERGSKYKNFAQSCMPNAVS